MVWVTLMWRSAGTGNCVLGHPGSQAGCEPRRADLQTTSEFVS